MFVRSAKYRAQAQSRPRTGAPQHVEKASTPFPAVSGLAPALGNRGHRTTHDILLHLPRGALARCGLAPSVSHPQRAAARRMSAAPNRPASCETLRALAYVNAYWPCPVTVCVCHAETIRNLPHLACVQRMGE